MTLRLAFINNAMRYREITVESVADTRDIHLASQWVADAIMRHKMPIDKMFDAHYIFNLDGKDTLPIDHGPVSDLLLDDNLKFLIGRDKVSSRGHTALGTFMPGKNIIWINSNLMRKGVASMASTIGHELRHALDFSLSRGKLFKKSSDLPSSDRYLRNPQEINARFTQALWAMAFETLKAKPKTAHDALKLIDDCLYRLHLDRALFPEGPKGDRQFNRLRTRAISYWTQVARFMEAAEAEEMPRKTIMDRVKVFISRMASSLKL